MVNVMGLDMYLSAEKYVSPYTDKDMYEKINSIDFPGKEIEGACIKELTIDVGYWRKANQIHKWFVDNIQDGNDDCGKYYVSKEQLRDLLKDVKTVLGDTTKASEILPSHSGFFFGGIDYDEWYYRDLEYTEKLLTQILTCESLTGEGSYVDFYYRSSW